MMRLLPLVLALLTPVAARGQTPPLFETRGVWFATVLRDGGWPADGDDAEAQEAALRLRIGQAHALGLNTFVFQAVARGDALYPSTRLPWSPLPRGAGEDPGYDPLAVAVDEAHRLGMEVHAWINVFRVGDTSTLARFENVRDPAHVAFAQPDWVAQEEGNLWIDPSNEDARAWLVDNVLEVVLGYDVDAVHFDFIRYPQGGLSRDGETFQADPNNADFATIDDWRRHNVTQFARAAHRAVLDAKPWVKVGATPIGNYRDTNGWPALFGFSDVFQESRRWLQEGLHDYLAPQIYWNIPDPPRFDVLAREWVREAAGRPIFTGIAAYKADVQAEIDVEIDTARAAGAAGQVFFRFEHLLQAASRIAARYPHPALPAPMTHRFEAAPPATPADFAAQRGEPETGGFSITLTWTPADGTPADPVRGYAVFRRAGTPPDPARAEDLLAVVDRRQASFTQAFDAPPADPLYYRVAALSRLGMVSPATAAVSTAQAPVAVDDAPPPAFRLDAVYPDPVRDEATVTFEIDRSGDVALVVYDVLGRSVAVLARGHQAPGRYRVRLDAAAWPAGAYWLALRAGAAQRVRSFLVVR